MHAQNEETPLSLHDGLYVYRNEQHESSTSALLRNVEKIDTARTHMPKKGRTGLRQTATPEERARSCGQHLVLARTIHRSRYRSHHIWQRG
jgi:hypothetical protein